MDRKLHAKAARQLGLLTVKDLYAAGVTRSGVAHLVNSGRLRRIKRGLFAISGIPSTRDQELLAHCLGLGESAVVSHSTAAYKFGLLEWSDPIHLSTTKRRGPCSGVMIHDRVTFLKGERTTIGPIPVTSPVRTVWDLASMMPVGSVIDKGLRAGLFTLDRLRRALECHEGCKGTATYREALDIRDPEYVPTDSELEDWVETQIIAAGLSPPTRQFILAEGGRFVARVDLAYPEHRLAIEVDGYAHHSGESSFHDDRRRWNRIRDAGWEIYFATASKEGMPDLIRYVRRKVGSASKPRG